MIELAWCQSGSCVDIFCIPPSESSCCDDMQLCVISQVKRFTHEYLHAYVLPVILLGRGCRVRVYEDDCLAVYPVVTRTGVGPKP